MRKLMLGNEAIAWGAIMAGVEVATGYPGTPSTEIMETLAKHHKEYGYQVEWSVNEKVALETAIGASYAGARVIVTMKQVGLNVAADPLMTSAYLGVNGGLVIVVADDPGPHSSQNEQDTRLFARFAKLPVLDPSTPQEAMEMTTYAFELSENLGIPVILRPTTRVCHVSQDVEINEEYNYQDKKIRSFKRDPRWVIFPSTAYKRHIILNSLQKQLAEINNSSRFNAITGDSEFGVIVSGNSTNYLVELCETYKLSLSVLKIGTPYPIPEKLVIDFLTNKKTVLIIEEQEPVLEEQVERLAWRNKLNFTLHGKDVLPREGEFNEVIIASSISTAFGIEIDLPVTQFEPLELPLRLPTLCAGCPHRNSFYILKEASKGINVVYHGDIGCYTLGVMQPLQTTDTCICMGAGINLAAGMSKVAVDQKQIAFIGDGTFFHSGITGIINTLFNKADILLVILDNSSTAMTGHQPHPGISKNLMGDVVESVDIFSLIKAMGVKNVEQINPLYVDKAIETTQALLAKPGVKVLIMKEPCIAIKKRTSIYKVNDYCSGCQLCIMKTGCPAMSLEEEKIVISSTCYGCGLCSSICPTNCIEEVILDV